MTEANTQTGARRELISFRIGEQEFCVDIMAVREIRGWTPTTPLPQAPDYMKGVVNLRGLVLPIIDLAALYMRGLDRLDGALMEAQFWPEARFEYGIFSGGPADLAGFCMAALKEHARNHHMLGQHLIGAFAQFFPIVLAHA